MPDLDLASILEGLRRAYPRTDVPAETVVVYARMLEDLDLAALAAAVKKHVQSSPYFPSIAELRLAVVERTLGLPSPIAAWELANRRAFERSARLPCPEGCDDGWQDRDRDLVCPRCHGEGTVAGPRATLPAPVSRATLAVGGEPALREATGDGVSVLRSQFLRAYEVFRREAIEQRNVGEVTGPTAAREILPSEGASPLAPRLRSV